MELVNQLNVRKFPTLELRNPETSTSCVTHGRVTWNYTKITGKNSRWMLYLSIG